MKAKGENNKDTKSSTRREVKLTTSDKRTIAKESLPGIKKAMDKYKKPHSTER